MKLLIILTIVGALGGALVESRPQDFLGNGYTGEYAHHPRYSFSYGVEEPLTGDFKNHQETRDGDSVQGSYSLLEPDGSHRRVEYTVSGGSGFNAIVSRNGVPVNGPSTNSYIRQPYYNPRFNPSAFFSAPYALHNYPY